MPKRGSSTMKKRQHPERSFKIKIVEIFLGILNTIKLYHWNTYSFAQHNATDELYLTMNKHIDKFVEIMMGKEDCRIPEFDKKIVLSNKPDFKSKIEQYREFLIHLSTVLDEKKDTDLLNVRDEILGDINQFLYQMSMTK
jgi:hypothetical protein